MNQDQPTLHIVGADINIMKNFNAAKDGINGARQTPFELLLVSEKSFYHLVRGNCGST